VWRDTNNVGKIPTNEANGAKETVPQAGKRSGTVAHDQTERKRVDDHHSTESPQLTHIRKTALDELIRCAKQSFSEEELFYLADGIETAALGKYSARLMAGEAFVGTGIE